MKPVDLRNATWADIQAALADRLLRVHLAWLDHGPGTTREVAARSGVDLLTLRPRSTDLYQIGALELLERIGHEGVYRARDMADWEKWILAHRQVSVSGQQQLI